MQQEESSLRVSLFLLILLQKIKGDPSRNALISFMVKYTTILRRQ